MSLQCISNPKERKVGDAADEIKWIIRRVAVELILNEDLVGNAEPPIQTQTERIRRRFQLRDGAIIGIPSSLNRYVWRRIKTGERDAGWAEPILRNPIAREGETGVRIDEGYRGK